MILLQAGDLGWWASIWPKLQTFGINLLMAILIFLIGRWVAGIIRNVIRRMMEKKNVDKTLVNFITSIVFALLMLFVIIAAIGKLGVQTTSLVAIIGAAGLAVGLALQGSLANFAAGVMIILFRPFKIGDTITAAGQTGVVQDIGIFSTIILTSDNKKIIVPNSAITGGAITNATAMPTRRVELNVGVPGATDLNRGRDIILGVLNADQRVLRDPAPSISIADANAAEIKYGVFAHVNTPDLGSVQSSLVEKIKHALTEAGIWA